MICIYRACNAEIDHKDFKDERPEWFSKKSCFKSFLDSNRDEMDIYVIFDGDPNCELATYIKSQHITGFIKINYRNNGLSLLSCYELAHKLDFDGVYFLEDDYLHTIDGISVLSDGIRSFPKNILTLYDHPDRYTRDDDVTRGKEEIYLSKLAHWRTAESTTCTVAMTKDMFESIRRDMMMFTNADRPMYRYLIDKNIRLLTPIIGRSTHVNKYFMSPLMDWSPK